MRNERIELLRKPVTDVLGSFSQVKIEYSIVASQRFFAFGAVRLKCRALNLAQKFHQNTLKNFRRKVKIALIGDSMMEKWGPQCPQLQAELSRVFTRTTVEIDNHGLSGTRAGHGLWRIAHDYKDSGGQYRSCLSYNDPDIVIIESFAYTNCADDAESLPEYRDVLRSLWEEVGRTTAAKILFLTTIPPDRDKFLETSNNYYYTSKITRQRMADRATLYLQEALNIAEDEEWPIADVYSEVQKKVVGGDKLRRYINQSDCLHPSVYGYQAVARVIVRAIDKYEMIKEVIPK